MWSHLKKWMGTGLKGFRAGGWAIGVSVDKLGDWSVAVMRTLLANPALGVAIVTAILFTVARIPTEIYYAYFGVRPEEVGLNSVQVLLQGSAVVLLATIIASALLALTLVLVVALIAGLYSLLVGLFRKQAKRYVSRSVRRTLRLGALLIPMISVGLGTWSLIELASEDAHTVGRGKPLDGIFIPWKASSVAARWNMPRGHLRLPGCRWLYYLGEGDHRVVLYNALRGKTYQIDSADVQLEFPLQCR